MLVKGGTGDTVIHITFLRRDIRKHNVLLESLASFQTQTFISKGIDVRYMFVPWCMISFYLVEYVCDDYCMSLFELERRDELSRMICFHKGRVSVAPQDWNTFTLLHQVWNKIENVLVSNMLQVKCRQVLLYITWINYAINTYHISSNPWWECNVHIAARRSFIS